MALLHLDGFDKFGGINAVGTNVVALLTAGEWTSVTSTSHQIVAPLSSTGFAVQLGTSATMTKTLPTTYSRLIGGIRFSSTLQANAGLSFLDAGTAQASITVNTTGTVSVRTGSITGTVLGTSSATVTANTTHYLEWDITFANAGLYQLWLDGVSILSGSGDTTGTANSYANQLQLAVAAVTGAIIYDDLYLFDTSGSTNNAVLTTSPRIETQFPTSDGAVQFAIGASLVGSSTSRSTGSYNAAANNLYVRPIIPTANCTVNAIGVLPAATNASVQLRPVLYADSSGVPGALLSAGSTVVGMTSGVMQNLPLTTPQALVAGTRYWLGAMNDLALSTGYTTQDTSAAGRSATATFASGAPGTAPATTAGQVTAVIFGVASGVATNAYEVSQNPPQGTYSYLYDATVGHEDLYNFPALTAAAPTIYAAAVKGSVAKSDAGAKTISLRTKSGATDSAGSASSLAPGTSYGWMTSLFATDPNTGAAWTVAALNAAQGGVKVET